MQGLRVHKDDTETLTMTDNDLYIDLPNFFCMGCYLE